MGNEPPLTLPKIDPDSRMLRYAYGRPGRKLFTKKVFS